MNRKKVIWIEDDLDLVRNLRQMFFDNGILIEHCSTVNEAHSKLKSNLSKYLLVDVEFPNSRKEGIKFLNNIASEFPNLKTVVYTGFPETDDAVNVVKDKLAADYIRKGNLNNEYEIKEFFKRLHKVFEGQKLNPRSIHKETKTESRKINPGWGILIIAILAFLFGQNQLEGCSSKGTEDKNSKTVSKTDQVAVIILDTIKLQYLETQPILDKTINVSYSYNDFRIGGINRKSLQLNGKSIDGNQLKFEKQSEYVKTDIHGLPQVEIKLDSNLYELKVIGRMHNYNLVIRPIQSNLLELFDYENIETTANK